MLMITRLKQMTLEIASGENQFTMKRGSFKYRMKHSERRTVKLTECVDTPTGYTLYYGNGSDSECVFELSREGGLLHLKCQKSPGNVNRWNISFPADKDEHFYGCGETYSKFDLSGENVRIWVAEHQNTSRIAGKLIRRAVMGPSYSRNLSFSAYESYYAQPTFVSSRGYFVHVNTDSYAEFDFSKPGIITLRLQSIPDIFIAEETDFTSLSKSLSGLLGRQSKLPEWIYDGGILAIQEGPDVIEEKLQKALDAGAAVNGIWSQDWCGCRRTGFGYQVMWNWEYDHQLYPDLPNKIKDWRSRGIRFLGYINPFLAIEGSLYAEASEKGYCVKAGDGSDYLVTITTFPAAMVDFTNPDAYDWYKNIIKNNMIGIGMSGWMADFGEYLPVDSVLYSGVDPETIHNRWPAIWARLNSEAIEETGTKDEVFFFTRSGHTDTIAASAMMWTGDQHVDWSEDDGIASVITASLSLAMSGYGITHSDVGGYTTFGRMCRSKELLMRWMELGTFSPLFRTHEGNQPSKNAQFCDDEELLAQLALCTRIHAALAPYLKKLTDEAVQDGTPVMRPLFFYYDSPEAFTCTNEYLLGRDILVAPVVKQGHEKRNVYLPDDSWVHAFTLEEYSGGSHMVKAPIGAPPVFVRKDSQQCKQLLECIRQTI